MLDRYGGVGRSWAVVAALVLVLTVTTAGCTSADRAVSTSMAGGFLRRLGSDGGFAAVADWRGLRRPSNAVREYFEFHRAVYRVISAQRDRADLVVWQTDQGAEPFNANVEGTGHGCVTLVRAGPRRVRWRVQPCPAHLGPPAESAYTSWGRDANAVAAAEVVVSRVDFDVRWLLTRDAKGYPRRVPATRAQVLATIRAVSDPSGALEVTLFKRQLAARFAATVMASASATDPVDTRRTLAASSCVIVDVRSDGTDPSGLLTVANPARCP